MNLEEIQLDAKAGAVEMEIVFGHAQVGVYKIYLWDQNGKNPKLIAHGNNIDQIADRFNLEETPDQLNLHILSWEVSIQAVGSGPGQHYSMVIMVRQQGQIRPGGLIQEAGQFKNGTVVLFGFRRFVTS